ncbi:NADH-ubiquinone oxidoreductase-F iron-sulfur binding region domain-containing protein [Natronococcus sp. A-GB7]|uniref:NADH-ubiquinone oxidoreductase-F iron-sulfur binding region domain-containing protein n=1 Tax=Natronococcus sp. A-GB7 TaxID=3037649 RepID=UPI00241CA2F4|nr:NADH-ubiquinone oxidoreductase-F iron-sulfur binding region domain-containing protein [Natronococcus sp. A-GB7]MDG5817665.1 NADH-ubiquinone oxidoreductase-F iron-sulfur binding region domain-containing protein [Natronococcus sp. A-GB7]
MERKSAFDARAVLRVPASSRSIGTDAVRATVSENRTQSPSIVAVGPTGIAALDPCLAATLGERTAFFADPDQACTEDVAESLARNELPTADATAVVEHDPGATTLPGGEDAPFAVDRGRVLGACGWTRPTAIADYTARGPVLADGDGGVLERAVASGLRGRGRGDIASDEPIGDCWQTTASADGEPVVVVHANEADPRVNVDSLLLAADPLAVLDPAVAVADRVGASELVVYCNEDDERVHRTAADAAARLEEVVDVDVSIDVVAGPDEYAAGEPTMALEALEGAERLEARRRPPGPAEYGLHGRPTVIHTPRTLAQLRAIALDDGVGGADDDPGTRLFEVGGDLADSTVFEVSTDGALATAIEPLGIDEPALACVGGVFGGLTETLDVSANATELAAAGLGTNGAIELFSEDRCPVALAGRRAAFARETNCGRCVPCREGATQLTELLRSTYEREDAIDEARELARVMERSSLCGFGRDAARPTTTALEAFEPEFVAHANGRCPAGECNGGNP